MSKKRRQQKQAEKRQVAASKQVVNKNKKTTKKAKKTNIVAGRIYILSTFNNTVVTCTDMTGNVVAQCSTGKVGFKGTKKSTPFAANQTAKTVIDRFEPLGIKKVEVYVKGVGPGRDAALRVLGHSGVEVTSIRDVTPVPHNGARPRKARRV